MVQADMSKVLASVKAEEGIVLTVLTVLTVLDIVHSERRNQHEWE